MATQAIKPKKAVWEEAFYKEVEQKLVSFGRFVFCLVSSLLSAPCGLVTANFGHLLDFT